MKSLVVAFVLVALSGCALFGKPMTPEEVKRYEQQEAERSAQEAARRQQEIADSQNSPRCYSKEDCDRMWMAARSWVAKSIAWKVQTASEGYLETYNPARHAPESAARVVQEPIPNDGYQLTLTLWCNNMFGCNPSQESGRASFNRYVWDAAKKRPPFEPSK